MIWSKRSSKRMMAALLSAVPFAYYARLGPQKLQVTVGSDGLAPVHVACFVEGRRMTAVDRYPQNSEYVYKNGTYQFSTQDIGKDVEIWYRYERIFS